MPGLRPKLDPEATATATAPSAAKKTPPRSPRLVQQQDGDPGEETVGNRTVTSPRAACRTFPSKKTIPRACCCAQDPPTIHGDTGEKTTEANHAVPSPCDASPPPRAHGQPATTTSTRHQATHAAVAVAPRTDRRKDARSNAAGEVVTTYPCLAPASRYATAPAPIPFDWPIPYRGIFPKPYAPSSARVVFPGAIPSHQLPRTAAVVALARTQPQGSVDFKRKREAPADSAKIKEHLLPVSEELVKYSIEQPHIDFEVVPELMRSEPWRKIWEEQPLILRDSDIVQAAKDSGVQVNVAQIITEILQNHPGPIAYFRVDTCQITSKQMIEDWFEFLRRKHIKEVVFLTSSLPYSFLEFSVTHINCKSLEKVSLSCMKLSDIFLQHADNLKEINIRSCSITAHDLYALSFECKHLQVLNISLYEGDVIRINSQTLEVLKIWYCTVRKVAVQNALRLKRVLVATGPNKASMKVRIWIQDAPVLAVASFDLSSQFVSVCDLKCKTDAASLDRIRKLFLHVSFNSEKEKKALLKLLESSKTLRELILWRNDKIYPFEFLFATLDDWPYQFKDLSCLKFHLEVFMIKDCKGGEAEFSISSAVLEHSSCLKQLILEGDIFQDETISIQAKDKLEKVARLCKSAVLTVKSGFSDYDNQLASFLEEV